MSALWLAVTWLVLGIVGAAAVRVAGRARVEIAVPLLMATAAALALGVGTSNWVGPLASAGVIELQLGRLPAGMLLLGAVSIACARLVGGRGSGGDTLTLGVAGAASVVVVTAPSPLVWALGLVVGVGAVGLRWVLAAPGRATLAAPRVAGTGALVALSVAPFYPVPNGIDRAVPELVAWLLTGAIVILLALQPLGGWALSGARAVRGGDFAPWLLLLVPATVLTAVRIPESVPVLSASIVRSVLFDAGLASAFWGALLACVGRREDRFIRCAMADIGLAVAAVGGRGNARVAAVALVLAGVLLAAPVLLHRGEGTAPRWLRLVAWATLAGLPPSVSFWGRLLALETVAGSGGVSMTFAVVACFLLMAATCREMLAVSAEHGVTPRGSLRTVFNVGLAVALVGAGLIPGVLTRGLFGGA